MGGSSSSRLGPKRPGPPARGFRRDGRGTMRPSRRSRQTTTGPPTRISSCTARGSEHPSLLQGRSSHPTGSLKHRLARSLFLYGLCNDWIGPDTTIIEASSGSTAVSEAYFARMLGLRFIAVVPRSVAAAKIELIRFQGGETTMSTIRPTFTRKRRASPGRPAAITWTSLPLPSARPIGAATTILRSPFSGS